MKKHILVSTMRWATASLVAVTLFGVGCAKKNDNGGGSNPNLPANPADSRGANPGLTYQSGGTATFVPDNMTVMSAYVGTHPLNNPTSFQINVNVRDLGAGRYGGDLQISYYDNSNYYNGYFQSGTGTVSGSAHYNGKSEAEFNQWFGASGQKAFHGFFQDQYGAIVLVVDDTLSNADGGLPATVNGSIWFKNFPPQNCSILPPLAYGCGQSTLKCWFIEARPFDCRAFMDASGIVQTISAVNPGNGYTRLGRFTGLDTRKAFNTP